MTKRTARRSAKGLPPLSDAQMEIMDVVWDQEETTVGEVWRQLAAKRPIARNTVQTVMVRLEGRGWLRHRAEGPKKFFYSAVVGRTRTLRGMVDSLVDVAFKGSADGLVMALLQGRGVSEEEIGRIREMIHETEREEKPK